MVENVMVMENVSVFHSCWLYLLVPPRTTRIKGLMQKEMFIEQVFVKAKGLTSSSYRLRYVI